MDQFGLAPVLLKLDASTSDVYLSTHWMVFMATNAAARNVIVRSESLHTC